MGSGSLRAGASLSLSGRYAVGGRQAAAALEAWAAARGARLSVEDDGSEPERAARLTVALARRCDLLLGPYGSGPTRAVVAALAGTPTVLWNHGGAATAERAGVRMVDILGPAQRYWAGLAELWAGEGIDLFRVAILAGTSPFGRATARGAVASLRAAGHGPLLVAPLTEATAAESVVTAARAGAAAVVGCGRLEEDLALGAALAGDAQDEVAIALVVCGVGLAHERLGDALEGWIGPSQWWPGGVAPPIALPPGSDYPAAQALAAALVAEEALATAGGGGPDALWDAARALRTRTFLGPFAVDSEGRQVAHAPCLVRWVRRQGRLVRELAWRPPTQAP